MAAIFRGLNVLTGLSNVNDRMATFLLYCKTIFKDMQMYVTIILEMLMLYM